MNHSYLELGLGLAVNTKTQRNNDLRWEFISFLRESCEVGKLFVVTVGSELAWSALLSTSCSTAETIREGEWELKFSPSSWPGAVTMRKKHCLPNQRKHLFVCLQSARMCASCLFVLYFLKNFNYKLC